MGRGFFGHKGWGKQGRGLGLGLGRRRRGQGAGHGAALCTACPIGNSLNEAAPGTTCRILRLMGCGPVRQRLLDLGIRPCREVTVVRNAPLNDPIELRVGDSFIVLRRREAAQIEVEHV
ncbi:FeoA family protein [Rhodovulum marinum]|uniref:Ferrous iron transport protein A n=1 Tax=Rhodovulum marinum TaxID=320662 RepID=A0A4R2PXF2_9RHOB|nr:FeoA family protein [Rhodovulum marinum]TCP38861.1 ferrous iron transport protein A [Rhodovulum marinum]